MRPCERYAVVEGFYRDNVVQWYVVDRALGRCLMATSKAGAEFEVKAMREHLWRKWKHRAANAIVSR